MSWNFWSQLLFQSEFQNSCDIWFFTNRNSWKVLKPSFDKFKIVLLTKVNEWLWTSDWKSWLLHLLWIIWFIIWFEEKNIDTKGSLVSFTLLISWIVSNPYMVRKEKKTISFHNKLVLLFFNFLCGNLYFMFEHPSSQKVFFIIHFWQ